MNSMEPEALELLRHSQLLSAYSEDALAELAARTERRELPAGAILFHEGDTADAVYIVAEGAVQVYVLGSDGYDAVLARLERGQFFGEQAFLSPRPRRRNSSVRAAEPTRLLAIPGERFQALLGLDSLARQALDARDLRDATVRAQHTSVLAHMLLGAMPGLPLERRSLSAGAIVCRAGDKSTEVFWIENGNAEVVREQQGELLVLSRLEKGSCFGERGVLHGEPRAATVVAATNLDLLVLDAETFLGALRADPRLATFFRSLEGLYALPRGGGLVLGAGQIEQRPVATALYRLIDGRQIAVVRGHDNDAVSFREVDVEDQQINWLDSPAAPEVRIGDVDGRLCALDAPGDWPDLAAAATALIDGQRLSEWSRSLFRHSGTLGFETPPVLGLDEEIVCGCTALSLGKLKPHLTGACTVDLLGRLTGAGTICGGCRPKLSELCGDASMHPVAIRCIDNAAPLIRRFVLTGIDDLLHEGATGQSRRSGGTGRWPLGPAQLYLDRPRRRSRGLGGGGQTGGPRTVLELAVLTGRSSVAGVPAAAE